VTGEWERFRRGLAVASGLVLEVLGLAAVLGLVPAAIASAKGYSFWLWWFYGWMLFIIALPHSLLLPNRKSRMVGAPYQAPSVPWSRPGRPAGEGLPEATEGGLAGAGRSLPGPEAPEGELAPAGAGELPLAACPSCGEQIRADTALCPFCGWVRGA
jgi:hypothetical protein